MKKRVVHRTILEKMVMNGNKCCKAKTEQHTPQIYTSSLQVKQENTGSTSQGCPEN